jgi:hypothetical protein
VVAPFHSDPRLSNLKIDDLADAAAVLSHLADFVALAGVTHGFDVAPTNDIFT